MMTFNHHDRPFVFLRWKEQFVVPDHKMTSLPGASFAGEESMYHASISKRVALTRGFVRWLRLLLHLHRLFLTCWRKCPSTFSKKTVHFASSHICVPESYPGP